MKNVLVASTAAALLVGAAAVVSAGPGTATTTSWNPNVSCAATLTTVEGVLGTQTSSLGGATFAGGGFTPGIPNKRSFTPPCSVVGPSGAMVPTFVEIHNVVVSCYNHATPSDGDYACILVDPNAPVGTTTYMKRIHIETDLKFQNASGWSVPPKNVPLDVQGFVYWDPNHTTSAQHSYTGWELHSFTAWRSATTTTAATKTKALSLEGGTCPLD
jgi:hypothetical protein